MIGIGGVRTPLTLPIRPEACLRLKFLHQQDCISLFDSQVVLTKRVLHFVKSVQSLLPSTGGGCSKVECFMSRI